MKKIICLCLIIFMTLPLVSCRAKNTAVFEFTMSPEKVIVDTKKDNFFAITVKTTCVSGEYIFHGSSTILGGYPVIIDEAGNRLVCSPKVVSPDKSWQEIREGDSFTQIWRFYRELYGAEYHWEPGSYDVEITFGNSKVVFEDAVILN